MFCPSCGKPLAPGEKFCSACGMFVGDMSLSSSNSTGSGSQQDRDVSATGNNSQNYTRDYQQNYQQDYQQNYQQDYQQNYQQDYRQDYQQNYQQDHSTDYQQDHSAKYQQNQQQKYDQAQPQEPLQQPGKKQPEKKPSGKKKHTGMIIAIIAAAIVIILLLIFVGIKVLRSAGGESGDSDGGILSALTQKDPDTVFTEYLDLIWKDVETIEGFETETIYVVNSYGVYFPDTQDADDYDSEYDLYGYYRMTKEVELDGITATLCLTYQQILNEELLRESYENDSDYEYLMERDGKVSGVFFYVDYDDCSQEEFQSFVEGIYGTYDYCFSAEAAQEIGLSLDYYEEYLGYVVYQWDELENGAFSAELIPDEDGATLYFYSRSITEDPLTAVNAINEAESVASVLDVLGDLYVAEKWYEETYEEESEFDLAQVIEDYGTDFTLSIETDGMIELPRNYLLVILTNDMNFSALYASYYSSSPIYIAKAEILVTVGSQQDTYDGYVMIGGVDDAWRVMFLDSDGDCDMAFYEDYLE